MNTCMTESLCCTWKLHSIVNQLYSNKMLKKNTWYRVSYVKSSFDLDNRNTSYLLSF